MYIVPRVEKLIHCVKYLLKSFRVPSTTTTAFLLDIAFKTCSGLVTSPTTISTLSFKFAGTLPSSLTNALTFNPKFFLCDC